MIIPNYPIILSQWHSTTASLETHPLYNYNNNNNNNDNNNQPYLMRVTQSSKYTEEPVALNSTNLKTNNITWKHQRLTM